MNRECKNCGCDEWTLILTDDYPERRRERDRTVKKVYRCEGCGEQGRRFIHNDGGPDIFSGAMRA